jgi:hypothetical protein
MLAPLGLKVRAAEEADTVLEEEAALMGKRWRMSRWRRQLQRQMQTTADNKQQSTTG